MKITVKGMQLTIVKSIIYVLFCLAMLTMSYFLLYENLMYYFFQIFLSWAFLLRFVILLGLIFILIYLCQLVDNALYGNQLSIVSNERYLEFETAAHSYQIPYDQLKLIILTKKKDVYSAIDVKAKQSLYFVLGSWLVSLKASDFENFRNALKKELKQQGFEYKEVTEQQGKNTVVQELFCKDYSGYVNQQYGKKKKTFIFLGIFFVFLIILTVFLVRIFSNDGVSIWDGKVIGANPSTYKALQTEGEIYSKVGADEGHTYWEDHKLSLLNPKTSVYLGGDYTKDTRHAYFRDQLLTNVDVATFEAVKHSRYNTPVYYFAKDKNRVYYKTISLPGLETKSAGSFDNSSRYVKDRQIVFYENTFLKGLDAQEAKVYDEEEYRTAYATDGWHHYFNGEPLPKTASNKYFGKTQIDLNTLKLLIPAGKGTYLYLFGDSGHLYFYDEFYKKMVMVFAFDQQVALRALDNGYFTDGKFTYTLNIHKVSTRSKAGTTIHGYDSEILRIENAKNPIVIASYAARAVR